MSDERGPWGDDEHPCPAGTHVYNAATQRCCFCWALQRGGYGPPSTPDRAFRDDAVVAAREFADRMERMIGEYVKMPEKKKAALLARLAQ